MTRAGLVRKNLFRKPLRTLLTGTAIAVAFLIFAVLGAFQFLFTATPEGVAASRLAVTNKVNFTEPLPISYVDRIRALPEVAVATHASWFGGYFQEPLNFLVAFAVDPETYLEAYSEFQAAPGVKEAFLADRTAIMVGETIAEQFGWKAGDRIPLRSNIFSQKSGGSDTWTFTIAGTFTSNDLSSSASYVFFHYEYFNESRSFGSNQIGNLTVVPKAGTDLTALSGKIDALFMNSSAETETRTEAAFNQSFFAQLGDIGFIITVVTGAAFVTILLIAGNTMMLTVRERTGEIGVLKTLGFTGSSVFGMILAEAVLLALLAGLIGFGLGCAAVQGLASSGIGFFEGLRMTWPIAAAGLMLMTGLGLVVGALPAWRAMNASIVAAFARK
jgi:putative ABC transport system permease protein